MVKSIKAWHSPILGWTWHATRDEGDGYWYGYVESPNSEWGTWSDDQLAEAKAIEMEPGEIPS